MNMTIGSKTGLPNQTLAWARKLCTRPSRTWPKLAVLAESKCNPNAALTKQTASNASPNFNDSIGSVYLPASLDLQPIGRG